MPNSQPSGMAVDSAEVDNLRIKAEQQDKLIDKLAMKVAEVSAKLELRIPGPARGLSRERLWYVWQ